MDAQPKQQSPKPKLRAYLVTVDNKEFTVIDPSGEGILALRKSLVRKFGFSRVNAVRPR